MVMFDSLVIYAFKTLELRVPELIPNTRWHRDLRQQQL